MILARKLLTLDLAEGALSDGVAQDVVADLHLDATAGSPASGAVGRLRHVSACATASALAGTSTNTPEEITRYWRFSGTFGDPKETI